MKLPRRTFLHLAATAAALPAAMHADAIAAADKIAAFLNALKRALWESGRPRLVSDGGDERGG